MLYISFLIGLILLIVGLLALIYLTSDHSQPKGKDKKCHDANRNDILPAH